MAADPPLDRLITVHYGRRDPLFSGPANHTVATWVAYLNANLRLPPGASPFPNGPTWDAGRRNVIYNGLGALYPDASTSAKHWARRIDFNPTTALLGGADVAAITDQLFTSYIVPLHIATIVRTTLEFDAQSATLPASHRGTYELDVTRGITAIIDPFDDVLRIVRASAPHPPDRRSHFRRIVVSTPAS